MVAYIRYIGKSIACFYIRFVELYTLAEIRCQFAQKKEELHTIFLLLYNYFRIK